MTMSCRHIASALVHQVARIRHVVELRARKSISVRSQRRRSLGGQNWGRTWKPDGLRSGVLNAAVLGLLFFLAAGQSQAQPIPAATDIHSAIRSADAAVIRQIIQQEGGAALNRPDNWGRTPLIVALQQGKTDIVEMLIGLGANLSLTDAWGRTPLLVATQLKNTDAIRLLLARGVNVDMANQNDITPLIAAAQTANHEAMKLLLRAGASVDKTDNLGWSALMWAASRNDGAAVKLLLDKGADVNVIGRDRATALELARHRGADVGLQASLATAEPGSRQAGTAVDTHWAQTPRVAAIEAKAVRIMPTIDADRIVRGRSDAMVTIVEYTDFQCPYCGFGAKTVEEILARYEGQARLVVKHLPLQFHPMAKPAAQYFEALSLQSAARAWAFYDRLFDNARALAGGEPFLRKLAADLDADMPRLDKDLASAIVRDRLAADWREGELYQFDGVPAFVINGQVIRGAQPAQVFVDLIEALLHR